MDPASADRVVEQWLEHDFAERWQSVAESAADDEEPERSDTRWRTFTGEDEDGAEPRRLAVVERDLPDGLFGFTRRDASHVVVNRRLYRVDKRQTVRHEKTHHRFPRDELTVRYINGDPEVRNTLSFQANNAGRLGRGSRGVSRTGAVAAYGSAHDTAGEDWVDAREYL